MKAAFRFIVKHRAFFILATLLVYATYLHGTNMFNFPYYESDEGTYTSQAWAVVTEGTLAPYTYWYDHPPLGWLVIAGWFSILPDSYFAFDERTD